MKNVRKEQHRRRRKLLDVRNLKSINPSHLRGIGRGNDFMKATIDVKNLLSIALVIPTTKI